MSFLQKLLRLVEKRTKSPKTHYCGNLEEEKGDKEVKKYTGTKQQQKKKKIKKIPPDE